MAARDLFFPFDVLDVNGEPFCLCNTVDILRLPEEVRRCSVFVFVLVVRATEGQRAHLGERAPTGKTETTDRTGSKGFTGHPGHR